MANKYVKKPIPVEAIVFEEDKIDEMLKFCDCLGYNSEEDAYYVSTLEGKMRICEGDYLVKGVKDEFYPCRKDIFELTYSPYRG